jgi:hypothetical protein
MKNIGEKTPDYMYLQDRIASKCLNGYKIILYYMAAGMSR